MTTADDSSMRGRVCLVTGANRGIGRATALGLARLGATVVVLGRDAVACARARDGISRESGNDAVSTIALDLASLESVRTAAAEVAARFDRVHVLVNNAGVNLARRAVSADGFEMTFAVNHLGPFLLTNLLLPLLRAGAPSRVITITSRMEQLGRIAFDDLELSRGYGAQRAYNQSKLANVLFTYELANRIASEGITSNCVHPGFVATDLLRDRFWWSRQLWGTVLLTPAQGAQVVVRLAASPDLENVTGRCFGSRGRVMQTSRASRDAAMRARLWRVSEELTGLADPVATAPSP